MTRDEIVRETLTRADRQERAHGPLRNRLVWQGEPGIGLEEVRKPRLQERESQGQTVKEAAPSGHEWSKCLFQGGMW